jgi:hypothetical protein
MTRHDDRARLFESIKHEFLTVPDSVALAELAGRAPFILDADFLVAVQGWLDEAEAAGGSDLAEGLRERLHVLHELVAQDMPSWRETIDAFADAGTSDELAALIDTNPLVRDPSFQTVIADLIVQAEELGDLDDAQALRLRLADLQHLLEQRELAGQSPLMQALLDFLNAPDNDTARTIFEQCRETLHSPDAELVISQGFAGGDPESQQRIEERAALLRLLRA